MTSYLGPLNRSDLNSVADSLQILPATSVSGIPDLIFSFSAVSLPISFSFASISFSMDDMAERSLRASI